MLHSEDVLGETVAKKIDEFIGHEQPIDNVTDFTPRTKKC